MRDAIRAATVGAPKHFLKELVELKGGLKVEVRQTSVASKSAILKASKIQSGDAEKIDFGALQVSATIECSFDPETGEKLFDEADRESLFGQPAGGFVDKISEVALKLMNVSVEAVEKNSERTPSGSSSSQ